MKAHIPNILTLGNLFLGCLAIIGILSGDYILVFWLTLVAGFLDLGDGIAARVLNVKSEVGKELDSLADMITFGVVPGMAMVVVLKAAVCGNTEWLESNCWLPYIGFVVTLAAAYRLAKFNIDTRQSDSFLGVPTPANTAFFIGIYMVHQANVLGLGDFMANHVWLIISLIFICSYLLISEIPMFSFKMKQSGWKGNEVQYSFIVVCLILVGLLIVTPLSWLTVPIGFVLYFLFSLIKNLRN